MKLETASAPPALTQDLLNSLLLLGISTLGGYFTWQVMNAPSGGSIHLRLLTILLVHPFALAAWVFCGLPGFGLALKSLLEAVHQRKVMASMLSLSLMVLTLVGLAFWI